MKITALFTLVLLCTSSGDSIDYRLPSSIQPTHYKVTIEPTLDGNIEPAPFSGEVTIDFDVTEYTNVITLHAVDLAISLADVFVTRDDNSRVNVVNATIDIERSFYIIHVETNLERNRKYTLNIRQFHGFLQTGFGLFLGKDQDETGVERRYAATHFQPTYGRQAFPCFDEPQMKATFIIELIRKANYTSLSNEQLLNTRDLGNGRFKDTFKRTVKMSTYLVAFIISGYGHTETIEKQTVYANPKIILSGEAQLTLDVAVEAFRVLDSYFEHVYDFDKIDHLIVSSSYVAYAVENFGLPTYTKQAVAYPMEKATSLDIERSITIITHEIAHHWLGNLVTCSWWQYFWLNEGFATYFHYYASDIIKPDWGFMDRFIITVMQPILVEDGMNGTVELNKEIEGKPRLPVHLKLAFYKGGAVIRMIEQFVTPDIFRKSLINYIEHRYSHAKVMSTTPTADATSFTTLIKFTDVHPSTLYHAIQETVDNENKETLLGGLKVKEILSTWDSQPGYPIVNVKRNYPAGSMTLTQKRFNGNPESEVNGTSLWHIPISYSVQNMHEPSENIWLTTREKTVGLFMDSSYWIIVNVNQTGYYRVNYDKKNWKLLISSLKYGDLNAIFPINRAQLIDDSFELAIGEELPFTTYLDLSMYIERETDYLPLASFFTGIKKLDVRLAATPEYGKFRHHVKFLLNRVYNQLGNTEGEADDHLTKLNRIDVLKWSCRFGNRRCMNDNLNKLREWQENGGYSISPNIEEQVLCGALRIGNQDDWDFVYDIYKNSDDDNQRSRIINALGCSEDVFILNGYFVKVYNNTTLRTSDRVAVFQAAIDAGNVGLNTAIHTIEENYSALNLYVDLLQVLNNICKRLTTDEQLIRITNIVTTHTSHASVEKIQEGMDSARLYKRWNERYLTSITDWLNENYEHVA